MSGCDRGRNARAEGPRRSVSKSLGRKSLQDEGDRSPPLGTESGDQQRGRPTQAGRERQVWVLVAPPARSAATWIPESPDTDPPQEGTQLCSLAVTADLAALCPLLHREASLPGPEDAGDVQGCPGATGQLGPRGRSGHRAAPSDPHLAAATASCPPHHTLRWQRGFGYLVSTRISWSGAAPSGKKGRRFVPALLSSDVEGHILSPWAQFPCRVQMARSLEVARCIRRPRAGPMGQVSGSPVQVGATRDTSGVLDRKDMRLHTGCGETMPRRLSGPASRLRVRKKPPQTAGARCALRLPGGLPSLWALARQVSLRDRWQMEGESHPPEASLRGP